MKQIKYIQPMDDVKKSRRRNRRLLMIFASLSLGVTRLSNVMRGASRGAGLLGAVSYGYFCGAWAGLSGKAAYRALFGE